MKKRIDFIIPGNQKCGTTTLHQLLRQHPEIRMSAKKELHFFGSKAFTSTEASYGAYHHRGWGTTDFDDEAFYGESTPKYASNTRNGEPHVLKRIKAYNPEIKLILLFRDPVDRAHSQWFMLRRRRFPDLPPFDEFITGLLDGASRKHSSVLLRGNYGSIVFNVLSNFPPNHCLFVTPTDLNDHLEEITKFIGASPFQYDALHLNVHTNKGTIDPSTVARLRDYYRAEVEIFSRLTGTDVRQWSG